MIQTIKTGWKAMLSTAFVTAAVTILLALFLSLVLGGSQRQLLNRVDMNAQQTRELICEISTSVHVDDPRITQICADVLGR